MVTGNEVCFRESVTPLSEGPKGRRPSAPQFLVPIPTRSDLERQKSARYHICGKGDFWGMGGGSDVPLLIAQMRRAIAEFLVELALRASVSYINPVMLIYFLVPACLSISPSLWDYKMN